MFSVLRNEETAHEDAIWTCCWRQRSDENGTHDLIVTGGLDSLGKLWKWNETNKALTCLTKLEGHSLGVISSDISTDASLAATSSTDCQIRVWNLQNEDCELQADIDASPMDSWQIKFSPDAQVIATGAAGGKVNLYNPMDGQKLHSLDTGGKFILSIAFSFTPQSPVGNLLAAASQEGIVYLFDVTTQQLVQNFESHAMAVRAMAFMPQSHVLITGADDKYIKVHDIHENGHQLVASYPGHSSWVLAVDASPTAKQFASGSADHTCRVWDMAQNQVLHTFKEHQDQVWGVSYNADGKRLLSVSEDKSLHVYDIP